MDGLPKLNFALPSARERTDWVMASGRREDEVLSVRVDMVGWGWMRL